MTCTSLAAATVTGLADTTTYLFDQDDGVQLGTVYDCSVFTVQVDGNSSLTSAPNSPVEIITLEMAGKSNYCVMGYRQTLTCTSLTKMMVYSWVLCMIAVCSQYKLMETQA